MKHITFVFLACIVFFTIVVQAQIMNAGFEDWEIDADGNNNPVGWQTTNSFPIINVEPSSPGYHGQFAVTVKTINAGFVFPGVVFFEGGYNFSQRPTKFFATIKSNIMLGDQAYIMLALMKGDSVVAAMDSCTFKIDSTISQFTNIEFPIAYISNLLPDSLIVMIASGIFGGQVGTELTVDEVGFMYGSTDVSNNEFILKSFELNQNYPNPFNPSTQISFSIPTSVFVTLKIYDLLGNEVATLINEEKQSGNYKLKFESKNLSSGVYFYKIQAGQFIEIKKMILLR